MSELMVVFVFAILVEAVINMTLGDVPVWGWVKKVAAYAVGITVCVIWKVGLIAMLGVENGIPIADYIITGIVISRGSNYLNQIITKLKGGDTTVTTTVSPNPTITTTEGENSTTTTISGES
jgi:hypothetical protein